MNREDAVVSLVSLAVLGFFFVRWLLRRAKLRRARNWPSELGRVQSTSVVLSSGGGQPGSAAFYAEVTYSYVVQGQTCSGVLRRRFLLEGRANKWMDSFAKSEVLTVRYNPQKIEDSVLLESDQAASYKGA
jgi:hypothetical protein